MHFVKAEDLKTGMRLARPIYSNQGALLYERDSKLTEQGIASIQSAGLIGIFVLGPAEPAPPMTWEEAEFERFGIMTAYSIQEEYDTILKTKKAPKAETIVSSIVKEYGHLEKKINFIQSLRSREDYIYKHALNTAILCTMIAHRMNIRIDEELDTVRGAVFKEIGKMGLPDAFVDKTEFTESENMHIWHAIESGFELVESVFSSGTAVKRICTQAENVLFHLRQGVYEADDKRMKTGAKILVVADTFERLTAMQYGREPESEVKAVKYLQKHPEVFNPEVVKALIDSINVLNSGVSVELNTGDRALVITENAQDVLRPMILSFKDNLMMDLSNREYDDIEIIDVMKTMDNRHVMDTNALNEKRGNTDASN